MDYLLMDESVLADAGLRPQSTEGDTGIPAVDARHIELPEMTCTKVMQLLAQIGRALKENRAHPGRMNEKELKGLKATAVQSHIELASRANSDEAR
jgi:hypothetical protein